MSSVAAPKIPDCCVISLRRSRARRPRRAATSDIDRWCSSSDCAACASYDIIPFEPAEEAGSSSTAAVSRPLLSMASTNSPVPLPLSTACVSMWNTHQVMQSKGSTPFVLCLKVIMRRSWLICCDQRFEPPGSAAAIFLHC